MADKIERIIADTFLQMAEGLETGNFGKKPKIALTGMGSEHGEENAMEAAKMAAKDGIEVYYIGTLEAEGVICGYHTLINWEKTDIEKVSALIEVRVTPQRGQGFDSIAERIYKYPEVRSVYLMSGAYDLMVILEGKTLREVSNFVSDKLSTLDSVLSTATHFILKKYKDHGTAFAVKKEDEREMITP